MNDCRCTLSSTTTTIRFHAPHGTDGSVSVARQNHDDALLAFSDHAPPSNCSLRSLLCLGLELYAPHIKLAIYFRPCRDHSSQFPWRVIWSRACQPEYTLTPHLYGPKTTGVHAALPMPFGMDCYDFVGAIVSPMPLPPPRPHCTGRIIEEGKGAFPLLLAHQPCTLW